jgi:glycosyltransferase involved in cell wall biosynthesis
MSELGGVLIELAEGAPAAVRDYLVALRDQLGAGVPIDVRWPGRAPEDLPGGVRLVGRGSGERALASAAARAVGRGHLLVLLAPLLPDAAVVRGLLAAFGLDWLVGFTQPRFADASGDGIRFLPNGAELGAELLPRQNLSLLPSHYLTTERLAACVAIRREVAAGFAATPEAAGGVPAALLREMCQARRRGYRNLVLNRLVVRSPEAPAALYPTLDPAARGDIQARFPDAFTADEWFTGAAHQRFETLAAKARRRRPDGKMHVLLDCRGTPAHHNGTSQATLGLLDGLVAEGPRWDVDLLFRSEAAAYHGVARRYPDLRVLTALPERRYGAAVCLDQPWHLSAVADLHRRGLAIAFNMLDTIAWDIVYVCSPEVGKAWRFIADHADGLLYNSAFTRERFNFRFPVAAEVAQVVTHHSLDPEEYRDPAAAASPEEDFVLVFGNPYEHKAVGPTVDLLTRAFPFQRIKAMGVDPGDRHNVTAIQSGHLPDAEIDRLVASARLVVFPSHYEGFGLPVVKALAHGRTVVVRSSPLWREIAGLTRMPGRLVEFVAPHELLEAVGKALAGEQVDALPLGSDLADGAAPARWRDCARRLIGLAEGMVAGADARRWFARDRALGLAGM